MAQKDRLCKTKHAHMCKVNTAQFKWWGTVYGLKVNQASENRNYYSFLRNVELNEIVVYITGGKTKTCLSWRKLCVFHNYRISNIMQTEPVTVPICNCIFHRYSCLYPPLYIKDLEVHSEITISLNMHTVYLKHCCSSCWHWNSNWNTAVHLVDTEIATETLLFILLTLK
jgi:hypothetical protein